jgi:signal transduction histidine kinase
MLVATTLLFLALVVGTALYLFLAVLIVRKRQKGAAEWLLLATACAAGLWHVARAAAFFYRISTGMEETSLLWALDLAGDLGLSLAPAFLIHFCLVWAKERAGWGGVFYLLTPASWWLLADQRTTELRWLLGAALLAAALTCVSVARRSGQRLHGSFLSAFAIALAAPAILLAAGANVALVAWAALAPPLCLAYFVYRYHLFGLLISRRVVFALSLGLFAAFYLFMVRRVAGFVEDEFDFLGPLAEIALIFAAALIWLPLYAWMNRFLTKRAQIYADFSKRLIQEAARILDIDHKLQYLAEQVGQTFHLRRALLLTSTSPRLEGRYGPVSSPPAESDLAALEASALTSRADFFHSHQTHDAEPRRILGQYGFNYAFPLWYENHLTGLLLLDTSPKIYLDDDDQVLLGLCRQISHSIETARVVEEKIHLEKALLDQQHLARLGAAAAAIAHEVKNPLSSIKTLAQLMREDPKIAANYERDLGFMVKEVDRLNGSVQQLLSFARPVREVKADVNLSELLENTVRVLSQHHQQGVRLEYVAGPPLPLQESNPDLLTQIILNLVLNAAQASEPSGHVKVWCAAAENGKTAFAVEDTGPGIPEDLRERVFDPFYTTKQKGTGLGLAIVKKNVTQLHGEIEIDSPLRDGRGTRVRVTLPTTR